MQIKPKVALVTGGALGNKSGGPSIGGAIAIQLAKDGFKVVVFDLSPSGKKTVDMINKNSGDAIFIQGDVRNTQNVKDALLITEEKYSGLSCLVNCAAYYSKGMANNIIQLPEEEWEKTLAVNLGGYYKFCKYGIPLILKSEGGTIINISSIESFTALPNFSVYSISKAAIDALTRTLAVDFAPAIRTNSICPGFVKIENSQNNRSEEQLEQWYRNIALQYPLKRICLVEEIANVASFLAGEKSSYINGQSLVVDGGKMISDLHDF